MLIKHHVGLNISFIIQEKRRKKKRKKKWKEKERGRKFKELAKAMTCTYELHIVHVRIANKFRPFHWKN